MPNIKQTNYSGSPGAFSVEERTWILLFWSSASPGDLELKPPLTSEKPKLVGVTSLTCIPWRCIFGSAKAIWIILALVVFPPFG